MQPFRLLHLSDLHLDTPFEGIRQEAPERVREMLTSAPYEAMEQAARRAVEERVHAVVIAGDIYDRERHSYYAQLRFRDMLRTLEDAGIPVFIAHGNHDPLGTWKVRTALPENTKVFRGEVTSYLIEPPDAPPVRFVGISFTRPDERENLARMFPAAGAQDPLTVGVLHTQVDAQPGHDPYAPCSLDDLLSRRYTYWALGHIHEPRVLTEEPAPVVYAGTPQGRHPREPGPHGGYFVDIHASGKVDIHFEAFDQIRWSSAHVRVEDVESLDTLEQKLELLLEEVRASSEQRPVLLRIYLEGRTEIYRELVHTQALQDLRTRLWEAEEDRDPFVWIESFVPHLQPPIPLESLRQREDLVGYLQWVVESERQDPEQLRQVLLQQSIPSMLKSWIQDIPASDLLDMLEDALMDLLGSLLDEEARA